MPKLFTRLLCLSTILLAGCNTEPTPETAETEIAPIAQVQTQKLDYTDISNTLTAYGSVTPLPSALKTLSVPYASRIQNVYVSNGQSINPSTPLLTLQPSEDAQLAVSQAKEELATALQEQKLVGQRLQLKLATQHEAITSQLRVAQAKAMLQDLTARGALQSHTLKADTAGVIAQVIVQPGQRLLAGSPLLQWLGQNQWGVTLGVEPEAAAQLRVQQAVALTPINRTVAPPISGRITLITQQVDPLTHLLNILVTPAANADLLLNEPVQGQITVVTKRTLVAPRTAVLPDAAAYSLFTVVNHHAVKHSVQLGIENDTQVEIIAPALKAQDELVVLGNYELQDGMAVEVKQP